MDNEFYKRQARNTEMKSNYYLMQQDIKKYKAIIKKQNEEIRELKKTISKLKIYQLKLGE